MPTPNSYSVESARKDPAWLSIPPTPSIPGSVQNKAAACFPGWAKSKSCEAGQFKVQESRSALQIDQCQRHRNSKAAIGSSGFKWGISRNVKSAHNVVGFIGFLRKRQWLRTQIRVQADASFRFVASHGTYCPSTSWFSAEPHKYGVSTADFSSALSTIACLQ